MTTPRTRHVCRAARVRTGYRAVCSCGWGGRFFGHNEQALAVAQRDEHKRKVEA